MGNFDVLSLLVSQPRRAFDALAERPSYWFPLLLAIAGGVLTTFWYYHAVDLPWLLDETLRSNPRTAAMTDEQRAQALRAMSPAVMRVSSVVVVVLAVVAIRLLQAAYFLLAGKIVNLQYSFRQWFSLANWTAVPTLLGVIPTAFVLATSTNGQIDASALNPLSLNELVFHRHMGEPGYQLFVNVSILQLLGWLLAWIGVHQWSKRSGLFAAVFVLLPAVLVYGAWAVISLR